MLRTLSRYVVVIAVALLVGIGLNALSSQEHLADQRLQVTQTSASIASRLQQTINEKVLITEGIAAVFVAEPQLPRDLFSRIVSNLVGNVEEVINVAAAPDLVIEYVYPLEPNRPAIGLDLRDYPEFMVAVETALLEDSTVVDGPFDLVQGGHGFITRSPVLTPGDNGDASSIWGVVSLVMDASLLFSASHFSQFEESLAVSVETRSGEHLYGRPNLEGEHPVQASVQVAGIDWVVSVVPLDGWAVQAPNSARIWAAVAAFAVLAMVIMRAFDWVFAKSERAETQLLEAIEALDDGFALFDEDDRLIVCNNRYKRMYSASAEAMVPGTHFEEILRFGLANGQYEQALGREDEWLADRLELHRSPGQPMEQRLSDGRWIRVVERLTPSGHTVGFRVDITALKKALDKAEAASAAKSDFLNTISHELRTPLTVVMGYNAFLSDPEKLPSYQNLLSALDSGNTSDIKSRFDAHQSDLRRFSRQINLSGQQLLELINGILDLAAIEEGTLQLKCEELCLRPICETVAEQFRPMAKQKNLQIHLEGNARKVFADPLRIRQILFNLIGNAVKFTPEGHVTVRLGESDSSVWIDVEDTGNGLAEDEMNIIFERFGQLDTSQAREHGGIGLGLPISKELAELHNGTVEAHSVQGRGSVFRLQLPALSLVTDDAA